MAPTKNMAAEAFTLGSQAYELAFQCDISGLTDLLANADKKVLDHNENVDGTTILMVASRDGNTSVVSALLALGPKKLNRDITDITGWTALHWAACGATDNGGSGLRPNATGDVVNLLLNAGLSCDAKGTDGETPADVALKMLNAPALKVFSEWTAAHGGRGVGVKIGVAGNGYVGAKYTDAEYTGSTPAAATAGHVSASAGVGALRKTPAAATAGHVSTSAGVGAPRKAPAAATAGLFSASAGFGAPRKTPVAHRLAHEAVAEALTPPAHVTTTVVEDEPQFPW